MALPPQLIGIKRRRHDEPVDVLYLEQDRSSNKRRFTDYVFQRLRPTEPAQPLPHAQKGYKSQTQEKVRSVSSYTIGGAPVVQATSPGAEFRDALQRRAVRAQLLHQQKDNLSSTDSVVPALLESGWGHCTDAGPAIPKPPLAARRFHLSRNNLILASSKHSGGIRKHKNHNTPHLATFVERHIDRFHDGELEFSSKSLAIDRLIDDADFRPQAGRGVQQNSSVEQSAKDASLLMEYSPERIHSFVKAPAELAKTGNSITDHPSTWDHDSDQLANELAAFALEISEEDRAGKREHSKMEKPGPQTAEIADTAMDVGHIFVYETYLRVPRSELPPHHEGKVNSVGMLVIEEQDEELWQTFAEDEEDSEWDEEDGDSNAEDNPRNDYPEDEVSSEDELGHSAYKYRHGASDDEEYDVEDVLSSDDGNEHV